MTVKAEKSSFPVLNHELVHNNLSAPPKTFGKNLDRVCTAAHIRMLGTFSRVDQRLGFWLARKVSKLGTGGDTQTRNWHNRGEQFQERPIQTLIPPLSRSLTPCRTLLPHRAVHFLSLFSNYPARSSYQSKLLTEPRALIFFTKSSEDGVPSTFRTIPLFSESFGSESQTSQAQ